ncbi:MAG: hypothetical protein NTZ83_01195, partial [Candidatus Pacearchaeota archaeon]|nr:hypothetical protein [Candidatus Pacearchaeota archaeon]
YCPETTEEETPTGLLDLSSNSGNSDDSLSGETQNPEENGNNAGITGAVTGAESSGNKGNFLILLGGLIFLLIIAIIVMVSVEKNMKKKLGAGVAEVNVQ